MGSYLADRHHVDDAGNLIACTYVDFREPAGFPASTLNKAQAISRPRNLSAAGLGPEGGPARVRRRNRQLHAACGT